MNEQKTQPDYEGSYLLGEADGEIWSGRAHPNEAQGLSLLSPEEVGQRDVFGQESAGWLQEQASAYNQQDRRFDSYSYYEGFLASVRRTRQSAAFAVVGAGHRGY